MTGRILLQGGAEFGPACADMDRTLVDATRTALRREPRVVVTTLAGAVGQDYRTATANGVDYYRSLGAADVVGAADVRVYRADALQVLGTADLVVLPGGSPSRLLTALTGTPVGSLLAGVLSRGGSLSGSSAGAMVLAEWTVLPEERGPAGVRVVRGLGLVRGIAVVPHYVPAQAVAGTSAPAAPAWLDAIRAQAAADTRVLALPECSGVLIEDGRWTALGAEDSHLFTGSTVDRFVRGDVPRSVPDKPGVSG